ncbi:hypothetical protein GCM10010520_23220 [Rhizobium viscosum]
MEFQFEAIFPLVLPGNIVLQTTRLAGPKALSAQTFKSDLAKVAFLESGKWAEYAHLFSRQVGLVEIPPMISLPVDGQWIAYPYALHRSYADGTCAVWIETTSRRPFARHVRLYCHEQAAIADNQIIAEILGRQR